MELIKQHLKWKRVKEIGKKGEGHIGQISPTNRTSPTWLPLLLAHTGSNSSSAAAQPGLASTATRPASLLLSARPTKPTWPNKCNQPAGPASRGPAWPVVARPC